MLIRRGMGDVSVPQLVGTTGSVAGSTLPLLLPLLGVAGPVGLAVGAAVAGATALLSAFGVGGGCGQSCVVASKNADAIESQMKANLAAFLAGQIDQQTALGNFEVLWNGLAQACGQIGGDAGKNCTADRKQGACKWRDASGECWNWYIGYRDPIAAASAPAAVAGGSFLPQLGGMSSLQLALLGLFGGFVVSEVIS